MVYKQFVNDTVLDADSLNTYLMNQANIRVDTVAARDALPVKTKGMRVECDDTGILYRYNGTVWRAIESDWIAFNSGYNISGTGVVFSTPSQSRYRFSAGRIIFLFSATMGSFQGYYVQLGLPVARDSVGGLAFSYAYAVHAGVRYEFRADFASTTAANFYFTSNGTSGQSTAMTGSSPVGWSGGDAFAVEMSYDPA